MKKSGKLNNAEGAPNGADQIVAYSQAQPLALRTICDFLRELIDAALPKATSKVWHGSPVWFIDDNPVVGYSATAKAVNLLFWNGQAFDEAGLKPVGKHRAAQATFVAVAEIAPTVVRRWLKKARSDVFDSNAFFKKLREGTENGMSAKKKPGTVDEYIESLPTDTRKTLLALRAIIRKAVPGATELFNYDIPAYALVKGGKRDKQIMIAGYKAFVGFYPGSGVLEHFSEELADYKVGKASVQFPNDQPLPKKLIVEIIQFKKSLLTDSSKS
ncbi:MAG: hypothetical protein JMDDDDMK_01343 [Acidobacteria bacterium]|nr:hypothetical protein [Acidobacteriota bacterium]